VRDGPDKTASLLDFPADRTWAVDEPDPEDRYKVFTGVLKLAAALGSLAYVIYLACEGRVLPNVLWECAAFACTALTFSFFVYRVVKWINRRDERRRTKRPRDAP
jgi:hypothetical protein